MPEKNQLSIVWHELYIQSIQTQGVMSRNQVQLQLGNISDKATLECLRTYQNEGLIQCIQKDKEVESVISNPFRESDFTWLHVTQKGSDRGENYYPEAKKE